MLFSVVQARLTRYEDREVWTEMSVSAIIQWYININAAC